MDVNLDLDTKVKIENGANGKFTMEYIVITGDINEQIYY